MRRRSTFFHDPKLDINPSQLQLSGNRFYIRNLDAAREERLTFGFDELPQELWQVLRQSHELHIRWSNEKNFQTSTPLFSRISPGLHISYTPLKEQKGDLLCPLIHKVFSTTIKCHSPNETFTSPPLVSSRFASTSSLQYHALLPSLSDLVAYIQRKICSNEDQSCMHSASLLNLADSLDIDYDSISHTLVVTAYWSHPPSVLFDPVTQEVTYNAWNLKVTSTSTTNKVEVGVLTNSKSTDPHELSLSGVLTVVGEDDAPAATLFSFPSRHHSLPLPQSSDQTYNVSFDKPTGLHPTLRITFPTASALVPPTNKPTDSTCALHTYLTLPSPIFPDPYQLSTTDPLFLASHNLIALRSLTGETDLEAPDYVLKKWGSTLLFELATPDPSTPTSKSSSSAAYSVTIPLHLRYLAPSPSSHTNITVPHPILFWACTAEEGTKFPVNPFDRVNLGYDGLFGPRTMFYHLDPDPGMAAGAGGRRLIETIEVPVLNTAAWGADWTEVGTVAVVVMGWAWVVWKVVSGLSRKGRGGGRDGERKKTQ